MPFSRAAVAVALVLLASPAAPADEAPDPVEAWRRACLDWIDGYFRQHHLDLARIDADALCDAATEKRRSGFSARFVTEWLTREIVKVQYDFAPVGATHSRVARYRFPFEAWIPRLLSQAEDGGTHQGKRNHWAWDFLMPVGTPVLAARAGTVVAVWGETPEGIPGEQDNGNLVRVLHRDGTFADYLHLRAGIPVKEGDVVSRGQLLGYSGHTGMSKVPHLHFSVARVDEEGDVQSLPILFGAKGSPGFTLKAGHHWGQIPRSRRELRVTVDGTRVTPGGAGSKDSPIRVRRGQQLALKVELVERNGLARDVTRDEGMRYESMTVWTLHCPEPGRLRIEPIHGITPEFVAEHLPVENKHEGLLFVYHGRPADPKFGMAQVHFDVADPAPAP